MNQRLQDILTSVKTDASEKWVSADVLPALIKEVVMECTEVVKITPVHCALTSYDLSVVRCTIEKSVNALLEQLH